MSQTITPTEAELASARQWAEARAKSFKAAQDAELTRTRGVYFGGMGLEPTTYDAAWIERETLSLAKMKARWRAEAASEQRGAA